MFRILALLLPLSLLASPALAAPRLTQGPADYVLMPLLGYLTLFAGAWLIHLLARKNRN